MRDYKGALIIVLLLAIFSIGIYFEEKGNHEYCIQMGAQGLTPNQCK